MHEIIFFDNNIPRSEPRQPKAVPLVKLLIRKDLFVGVVPTHQKVGHGNESVLCYAQYGYVMFSSASSRAAQRPWIFGWDCIN